MTQLVISKNIVWSLPVLFIIQLFMLFYIWYLLCSLRHCFLSMLRGEFFIKSSARISHDFLRTRIQNAPTGHNRPAHNTTCRFTMLMPMMIFFETGSSNYIYNGNEAIMDGH